MAGALFPWQEQPNFSLDGLSAVLSLPAGKSGFLPADSPVRCRKEMPDQKGETGFPAIVDPERNPSPVPEGRGTFFHGPPLKETPPRPNLGALDARRPALWRRLSLSADGSPVRTT